MSSIDTKSIVSQGLERRRKDLIQREEELEDQARKLQQTINHNHTARTLADAHKWERAKAKRKEMER